MAGWASVNEGTEGPPIWDVVESHIRKQGTVSLPENDSVDRDGHLSPSSQGDLRTMSESFGKKPTSRRAFLRGSAGGRGGAVDGAGAARAGTPDPLITEVQPWASTLGEGVDATPYGLPIRFEDDVIRRNVEWLTADTISSINFTPIHALDGTITPQGCAFERHHSGAIELRKEDYRLMINGLVDTPLVFTYADLERFPRENHVYFCECAANTGMEWAGAQLNGAQFTHGMIHNMEYTGVPLRTLLAEAGLDAAGDLKASGFMSRAPTPPRTAGRSRWTRRWTTFWWPSRPMARRCARSTAIPCAWWCRAGKATCGSSGCAASR